MLFVGQGTVKFARYQSPQALTARREAGFTATTADTRNFRLWFPPNPPTASFTIPPLVTPPTNSTTPTAPSTPVIVTKSILAQGSYTLTGQAWTAGLFAWERINGFGIRSDALLVALWAPALLLTTGGAWLWRRGRRRTPGLCPSCGYDVPGLPAGTPCPECGPPPPPQPSPPTPA